MSPKNKAVFLVESQPPHMGEFLQALTIFEKYDFLHVCLISRPMVMPTKTALSIWANILQPYSAKVKLAACSLKFDEAMVSDLPETYNDCTYITADRKIFVHLSSLNVPIELIPRALGYNSTFVRVAYRQSRALDWLERKFINTTK